ncbi:hypothetical protein D3C75_1001350 [compost metagenome]
MFRQHKIFKLLGISHTPDTIVFLHQLIAFANALGSDFFLRGKLIFNHLENPVKTRKCKYQHHHAANTRRFNKLLISG